MAVLHGILEDSHVSSWFQCQRVSTSVADKLRPAVIKPSKPSKWTWHLNSGDHSSNSVLVCFDFQNEGQRTIIIQRRKVTILLKWKAIFIYLWINLHFKCIILLPVWLYLQYPLFKSCLFLCHSFWCYVSYIPSFHMHIVGGWNQHKDDAASFPQETLKL